MDERVFITGIGMISAIGNNVEENFRSLRAQQSGLGFTRYIDTVHKNVLPVGEVKLSTDELGALAGKPHSPEFTRTTLLGLVANLQDTKPEDIDDNAPLFGEGLGLDSIDSLELMVLLERNYRIKVEDPREGRKILQSVQTMAEFIKSKQAA